MDSERQAATPNHAAKVTPPPDTARHEFRGRVPHPLSVIASKAVYGFSVASRHHRTPPETARPPCRRHDECKVAFKPPVRWTLPAKTHSRGFPTSAQRRLAPTSPSFAPTTSPAGRPRSGTSGLKATLLSPTPSTLARAHRAPEPRAMLIRTRHRRTAPKTARQPRRNRSRSAGRIPRSRPPTPKSFNVTRFPPPRERPPACVPCRGTLP
jgi:hypothetical protein